MTVEIENGAGLARVTCGWKRPELSLDRVRPYWRDVHSPAIARRAGLYEYRHYPLDPIRGDFFGAVPSIDLVGAADQQLMWLSDVRYKDQAGLEAFAASPRAEQRAKILGDIELIVDKSTTYLVVGEHGRTLVDLGGDPAPQGPAAYPTFQIFLRQRADQTAFREAVRALADRWAQTDGVVRVRRALFEIPDMEAERRGGYPIKTHPPSMQYQAWIDLGVRDAALGPALLTEADGREISAAHAYPTPSVYTFNWNGRPTLSGLRGYMAVEAIRGLGADHQKDAGLLEWMFGPIASGGVLA